MKSKKFIFIKQLKVLSILLLIFLFQSCGSSGGSSIKTDDPEKAYFIAKSRYDKRDYLDAIDDFNLIKLKFSGSNIIDKAIYYLGMSYYKREEYILATYEFENLLKSYPASTLAEDSRYMLASCYYNLSPKYSLDQSYTGYAITEFQNFVELYPGSKYKSDAEKKISELKNKLALKIYKSAEMYFDLGNYKSAIVYYDNILEDYFETEYADDALYGKIQALIFKKKYDLAESEIERFEKKFPESKYYSSVIKLKSNIPIQK